MADVKLTSQQQAAVDARGSGLLVSAAAGSGKTKVLVERLMGYLTDATNPANVDEFLIITFTKAAAAELRAKIRAAINERLEKDPDNRHLKKQLTRIYAAQISTVHSFCSALLRQYAAEVDISSDFRVAEPQQTQPIQVEAMENTMQHVYDELSENSELAACVDQLGYGRDDQSLRTLILKSHEKIYCHEDPEAWIGQCLDAYDFSERTDPGQTIWGAYWIRELQRTAKSCIEVLQTAVSLTKAEDKLEKYIPNLETDMELCRNLCAQTTWEGCRAALECGFVRLAVVRNCTQMDMQERIRALRELVKEQINGFKDVFCEDEANVMEALLKTAPAVRGFLAIVKRYDTEYHTLMRRRKLLDYADLEQYTIRLLIDRHTGNANALAKEISKKYREIMVDEYQDSNAVQDCIYRAVSREGKNLFMVGDVKQSIYGFRLADPGIFLEKYNSYQPLKQPVEDCPRKILLSSNFRSREEILEATNDVFCLAMQKESGGVDYAKSEQLVAGNPFPEVPEPRVEFLVKQTGGTDRDEESEEETAAKEEQEAELVANRIYRLLQEKTPVTDKNGLRPAEPRDIVILMRSPGNSVQTYQDALKRYNIPSTTNRGGNILQKAELEILMQMLCIVDNPHHEIELVGVMASPVFCFSPEELAYLRSSGKGDLYDRLMAQKDGNEKFSRFADWLTQMRSNSSVMPLSELVQTVIDSTNYDALCQSLSDGERRMQNLRIFCAYAEECASAQLMNLSQFVGRLRQMASMEKGLENKQPQQTGNAVQIMSTHESKGLEFPIVVLSDLSRGFNKTDLWDTLLLDDDLLLGSNVVELSEAASYPSLAKTAVANRLKRKLLEEDMRVLYVAMTRARDMLIMTHCRAGLVNRMVKQKNRLTVPCLPQYAMGVASPGEWVLAAAFLRTEAGQLFAKIGSFEESRVSKHPWKIVFYDENEKAEQTGRWQQEESGEAERHMPKLTPYDAGKYGHPEATKLPAKLTATQLKGRLLDMEAAEQTAQHLQHRWKDPSFLPEKPLTGAEKGNATHLFMQFAGYESCTTAAGIAEELARLQQQSFLSPRQAEAVSPEKILHLFASAFGKRILNAPNIEREFKFSVLVKARELLPTDCEDEVMLQGVVDCFWEEPDGLVIVDFKTDRVGADPTERAAYYTPQLQSYAKALQRIWQRPVKACYLYFFDADREVQVACS